MSILGCLGRGPVTGVDKALHCGVSERTRVETGMLPSPQKVVVHHAE
jgi:hypothetical protein